MAMLKWTVELSVDESWVMDGFDLTNDRAHAMIQNELPYSYGCETSAKVLSAPNPKVIKKLQGYD